VYAEGFGAARHLRNQVGEAIKNHPGMGASAAANQQITNQQTANHLHPCMKYKNLESRVLKRKREWQFD